MIILFVFVCVCVFFLYEYELYTTGGLSPDQYQYQCLVLFMLGCLWMMDVDDTLFIDLCLAWLGLAWLVLLKLMVSVSCK